MTIFGPVEFMESRKTSFSQEGLSLSRCCMFQAETVGNHTSLNCPEASNPSYGKQINSWPLASNVVCAAY